MLGLFRTILYVQLSPELLTIRDVKTGKTLSEIPELAFSAPPLPLGVKGPKQQVLGVGAQARAAMQGISEAILVNPFAHPRSLMSDFVVAEYILKAFLRRFFKGHFLILTPSPIIILHPLDQPEGGWTQVEYRAFRDLGQSAGASPVIVHVGDVLSDQQVLMLCQRKNRIPL